MIAVCFKALLFFTIALAFAALAAALADQTGEIIIRWLGWEIQTSIAVFFAFLGGLVLLWFLLRPLFRVGGAIIGGIFGKKPL